MEAGTAETLCGSAYENPSLQANANAEIQKQSCGQALPALSWSAISPVAPSPTQYGPVKSKVRSAEMNDTCAGLSLSLYTLHRSWPDSLGRFAFR